MGSATGAAELEKIMATRQMHLNKGGNGMAAKTACGRTLLRTPMSTDWKQFKAEPSEHQCVKCAASKYAAFLAKSDAKATEEKPFDMSGWEPEDDVFGWMKRDDALIAARRAK